MNSVLWSQGLFPTDPGYFIIDGEPSRYSKKSEQDDALELMDEGRFSILKKHREGQNTTPCFLVKRNKEWLCVEGNFNEKDSSDRLRVYRFITNLKKPDAVVQTLNEYANLMGCSVNKNDLKQLKTSLKSFFGLPLGKVLTIISTIIVIIAATISLVLDKQTKSHSNEHEEQKSTTCGLRMHT